MIRWILDRKWLSISLYSSALFLISAGLELINLNYLGLLFSASLLIATFFSRQLTWLSLAIFPISAYLLATFSAIPLIGALELSASLLLVAIFGSARQRNWALLSGTSGAVIIAWILGYDKTFLQSMLGQTPVTELVRLNSFLLILGLSTLMFAAAGLFGRLIFIKLEHVGSPEDKAIAQITSGRLRLEVAKQNERLEIAKDLSELLVQRITAVVSVTEGGRYAIASDPSSAERVLARAHEAARSAQVELRRLYDYLNSAIISDVATFRIADLHTLAVAYRELGYNTVLSEQGESFALNEGMELCVYKIVFESLKNVRKHAPVGTEIGIDFLWVEDGLQILIKDNGIEFANRSKRAIGELVEDYNATDDLESLISDFDGATLAALRDRAAIYKGRIEATKVPGVGFTLSAIFPNLKSLAAQGD